MQSVTSTWTAEEIRNSGYQVKPVEARDLESLALTTEEAFAVYNERGRLMYGAASKERCDQWVSDAIR